MQVYDTRCVIGSVRELFGQPTYINKQEQTKRAPVSTETLVIDPKAKDISALLSWNRWVEFDETLKDSNTQCPLTILSGADKSNCLMPWASAFIGRAIAYIDVHNFTTYK